MCEQLAGELYMCGSSCWSLRAGTSCKLRSCSVYDAYLLARSGRDNRSVLLRNLEQLLLSSEEMLSVMRFMRFSVWA